MIGIDLFSGAGGMSMGAIQAGIRVEFAVDINPQACKTYAHNHLGVKIINKAIEGITCHELSGLSRKQPLIVFGGPPCQGFSTSNQRTRDLKNTKNWLFREYLRLVRLIRPDWVVFENVTGILQTSQGFFIKEVHSRLTDLGYSTVQWLLNAVEYGVPQRRSRLFLIAQRSGKCPLRPPVKPFFISVKDAISDLPKLRNGATEHWLPYRCSPKSEYARAMRGKLKKAPNHLVTRNAGFILERYKYVPQGGNWESIPGALMKNYANRSRCHEWIYKRLTFDEPSVVIGNYRKNMLIHPTQDRGLSVREAARLQSFPDWYEFHGTIGAQQQQVGNAVPPLLSQAVFTAILSSIG